MQSIYNRPSAGASKLPNRGKRPNQRKEKVQLMNLSPATRERKTAKQSLPSRRETAPKEVALLKQRRAKQAVLTKKRTKSSHHFSSPKESRKAVSPFEKKENQQMGTNGVQKGWSPTTV